MFVCQWEGEYVTDVYDSWLALGGYVTDIYVS